MSTNYISQITATDGVTYDVQEGVTTRIFRATCSTAAATAAKVATLDDATGYSLVAGVRVAVTFTNGNTATSPTLNVNSGGAKSIHYRINTSTVQAVDELCVWGANETVIFTYNGSSWVMMGSSLALYNAYNKAASSGSGTITEVKTNAGAHTTIDVLSGKAEFNVPTTAAHVGAATSDHTHGNITNGGDITATAPTIASGDQIIINDNSASKITNGPTFDGSTTTTALTPKGTWESFVTGVKGNAESSYRTGQVNLTYTNVGAIGSRINGNTQELYRPIQLNGCNDNTLDQKISFLRANRLLFLPADQIIIEKTTDGGTTWVDAGYTDAQKRHLFSETQGAGISVPLLNGARNVNCGLRITITGMKYNVPAGTAETKKYNYWNSNYVLSMERYCQLKEMYFWVSTANGGLSCKVERATGSASTNWIQVYDSGSTFALTGWSGNDYIRFTQGVFGGGTTQTGNYWNYRFTFFQRSSTGTTTLPDTYTTSTGTLYEIRGYGDTDWSTTAVSHQFIKNDHIYKWDIDKNVTFPAQITATQFNGNLTGNVTGNVSGSAGSVPWSGVSSKPTSTGSATTSVTASTTATKTTLGTAFTIPNVTSAGSASTWAFEEVSIPNVTAAGSASTWAFEEVSIPNVTAAGSASTWTFGSTTVGDGTLVGAVDSSDSSMLVITAGTKSVQQKTGGANGTAPTIGTAIKVQSKKSGANGTAPTIGTAIKVQSKKSGANGSAPTLGTAFTVPNVTGNTSATVSITDNGHTHTI